MTTIFNTSPEYPKMHVWCKFGDSRPNLWRVIVQTSKVYGRTDRQMQATIPLWPERPWAKNCSPKRQEEAGIQQRMTKSSTDWERPTISCPTKFEPNAISTLSVNVQKLFNQSEAMKQQEFIGVRPKWIRPGEYQKECIYKVSHQSPERVVWKCTKNAWLIRD